jgi:hypothetical protein
MRKFLATAGVLAPLALAGPVLAQSQQGGYLGADPGAGATVAEAGAPQIGSMLGGYLGQNLGTGLTLFKPAPPSSFPTTPTAWCDYSVEPDRCRTRAVPDHAWCLKHNPQHYGNCRQTMDYVGWRL